MNAPPTIRFTPGLSPRHLFLHVVRPTLAWLNDADTGIDSEAAAELLIGTAAAESAFRAIDQITGPDDRALGPAFGLWQIEPATRADLHESYLRFRPALDRQVQALVAEWPSADVQLATNLAYGCAIARLVYRRSPRKLARPGDVAGHAAVWKAVYNTAAGKGTESHFVDAWSRLVGPVL